MVVKNKTFIALFVISALSLMYEVSATTVPIQQADLSPQDAERDALRKAVVSLQNGDLKTADILLKQAVDSPAFEQLNADEQHEVLLQGGLTAAQLGDSQRAHILLTRSSSMPEAVAVDWLYRFFTASAERGHEDAILSLTILAQQWPQTLDQIKDQEIIATVSAAKKATSKQSFWFDLLDALYLSGWRGDGSHDLSYWWRDLSLLLLEKDQIDRAAAVASKITYPYALIGMRVDRRFAPLVERDPAHYDVDAAQALELKKLRDRWQATPRSLDSLGKL